MDQLDGCCTEEEWQITYICLDPMDLNRALQRENFPLPTIEEVASRLHGTKVSRPLMFPVAECSFCTKFNTPFGRYHWKRMPLGIRPAPEVFRSKLNELIEGSRGLEVIANDFVVFGYGESSHSAIKDHDGNLLAFLSRNVMSAEFI